MKHSLLPLVIAFFLSACAGSVAGQIYLDENSNGFYDFDEPGAGSIRVTVTKDGKKYASGYTDADGTFSVKGGKGLFCILLQASEVVAVQSGSLAPPPQLQDPSASATLTTRQFGPPAATPGSSDTTGSGDSSSSSSGAPESSTLGSSGPSSTSSSTSSSKQVGQHCIEGQFGKNVSLEIPINPEYLAHVSEQPAPTERTARASETWTQPISYPCRCELRCYFPDLVTAIPVDASRVGSGSQPDVGVLHFSASLGEDAAASGPLCVENVDVTVDDELPARDVTTEIKCKALCPDGEHALRKIPIKLAGGVAIEVIQEPLGGGSSSSGGTLSVDIVVKNKNAIRIDDLRLTVSVDPAEFVFNTTDRSDICSPDLPFRCQPTFQTGEREQVINVIFSLPTVTQRKSYRIRASVDGPKLERPVDHTLTVQLEP